MLVQYSLVVYVPGGMLTQMIAQNPTVPEAYRPAYASYFRTRLSWYDDSAVGYLHIYQRWPERYFRWLFDPDAHLVYDWAENAYVQPGIDWNVAGLHLKGSGALTGDFGKSRWLAPITPVSEVIGPGYQLVLAVLLGLICTFMYVAFAQRKGRPRTYRAPGSIVPTFAGVKRLEAPNYRQVFWLA
jgi:hypothetical protein